jgi:hypothetical protein
MGEIKDEVHDRVESEFRTRPRPPMTILEEVAAERRRQIAEGYDAAHDDRHKDGSIARAAGAYALHEQSALVLLGPPSRPYRSRMVSAVWWWPWNQESYQPGAPRERLIKAAALIVAEIERLDRQGTEA